MIAVIYARYSSDLQREASIEDEIRLCRKRIEHEGWEYLHAYADRALSGASALRPAYQSLLEDARRGQFAIVVAEALDRLSRDQEDVAGLFKRLRFAGVRLFTLAEGEISELHVGLKGTMNALFLKDLAQKVRRGLEGRVRHGRFGGGLCFGYDVIREHDTRGEPIRGGREINQAEAAVVGRIFAEFAAGKSPRAIAHRLNSEDITGPHGKNWGPSTIYGNWRRGTGVLNNELYIGKLVWNRQSFIKDPATGKRQARPNPSDEWITRKRGLVAEVKQAPALRPRLHPKLADLYRQRVDRLHEELNRTELRSEAAQALRELIDEVRLIPEAGRLEIELLGDLAGILALSADSKKPVTEDRDGLQITLVAGIGFEPMTFRL